MEWIVGMVGEKQSAADPMSRGFADITAAPHY
jgi:hypothetical protein